MVYDYYFSELLSLASSIGFRVVFLLLAGIATAFAAIVFFARREMRASAAAIFPWPMALGCLALFGPPTQPDFLDFLVLTNGQTAVGFVLAATTIAFSVALFRLLDGDGDELRRD